ncbi:MAG: homoserine dehydrogenase [Anaerohalosphaeraceae bacterium]|nr:homoserine dehydrogenase [Anaerohalosphaeraceae bacterium]
MAEKTVKIGIVGFGVVGSGVAKILLAETESIAKKTGVRLELARIVDLDTKTPRPVELPQGILTDDLDGLINDKSIDIAVELVGGTGVAKEIHLKMLAAGKHVVTANKALLAEHGSELYSAAAKAGKCIAFEASCAGGVPIVSAIRTGLAANRIEAIYGIVNGTCNYILSSMAEGGKDFATALSQAQQKGYAEADPTLDINGGDSSHKLAILASIAFGQQVKLEDIFVEGIEDTDISDIRYGREMGYTLKLLAIADKSDNGKLSLRVHPAFVAEEDALARVNGPFNAVSIFGHAVGHTMFYGRGAGMMPTASAVVADIIEVAMGNSAKIFEHSIANISNPKALPIEKTDNLTSRFYIRLMVTDMPGVFAKICTALADNEISLSGVLQHEGHDNGNTVPAIITTHPGRESKISSALAELKNMDFVKARPVCIRIADIPEDRD